MPEQLKSPNFSFLSPHDTQLVRLGALAEHFFVVDPVTCLMKLRQFAETLAQLVAAKAGMFNSPSEEEQARYSAPERRTRPNSSQGCGGIHVTGGLRI